MFLGTTFSHRQIQHLGLDITPSLEKLLEIGFDVIRICVYWDEIEIASETWNFAPLERILTACQEHNQKVIICLGAKNPRWPEFYIPQHLPQDIHHLETQHALLQFLETTISRIKKYQNILLWQVENEPLDEVGSQKQVLPLQLLQQEVEIIRNNDNRNILLTVWGNQLMQRDFLPLLMPYADVLGIDLYYQQFIWSKAGIDIYVGPKDNDTTLKKYLRTIPKPVWITELQAEPWEKDEKKYRSRNPKSMSPQKLQQFFQRATSLDVPSILFWGYEYWLWKAEQGDSRYLDTIKEIIQQKRL